MLNSLCKSRHFIVYNGPCPLCRFSFWHRVLSTLNVARERIPATLVTPTRLAQGNHRKENVKKWMWKEWLLFLLLLLHAIK